MIQLLCAWLWTHSWSASSAQAGRADSLEWIVPLEAAQTAEVVALICAPVQQLRVQEGDRVAMGDTLGLLDEADLRLEEARAWLAFQKLQRRLERATQLHAQGGLSTQELESLGFETESARLRWEQARLDRCRTVLCAPLAGLVAECRVRRGDLTAPRMILVRLIDPEDLQAELLLPPDQLQGVHRHQRVRATPLATPTQRLQGQVTYLSPLLETDSGRCRVRLLFPQAGHTLQPGTLVRVQLNQE